jgi:hypothetical protein
MANFINGTVYEIDGAPTTYHITAFGVGDAALLDAYIGPNPNLYGIVQIASGRRYGVVETVQQLKNAAG